MTAPHIAGKAPLPVEVKAGETSYWCACGQSKNQPFCDGSHSKSPAAVARGLKSSPLTNTTDAPKDFYVCSCGHTKSEEGTCDGSHRKIVAKA